MCENEEGIHVHSLFPAFEACVQFHGHACPGLAMGYRVATAAMRELGVKRPYDEELVCIAETDACGVDAIQMVTGCTAGKGNLVIRDYGKQVFSFISRESGKAVRVMVRFADAPERSALDDLRKKVFSGTATAGEQERFSALTQAAIRQVLTVPEAGILDIRDTQIPPPHKARIFDSVTCARCGEQVADAKTRTLHGSRVCIPCAQLLSGKG